MWEYNKTEELYHYGVKGMRWGRRRFEKNAGSYTKTGLKVFDKKMNEYESAKAKTQSLKSGNKADYKKAKGEQKSAKKELNRSYDQLKRDKRADKGKALYEKGQTVTSNVYKNALAQVGIAAASGVVRNLIANKIGNTKVANISAAATFIGGEVVSDIIFGKTLSNNRNLRAYYGHTRTVR